LLILYKQKNFSLIFTKIINMLKTFKTLYTFTLTF
jgi:hypothetical protein